MPRIPRGNGRSLYNPITLVLKALLPWFGSGGLWVSWPVYSPALPSYSQNPAAELLSEFVQLPLPGCAGMGQGEIGQRKQILVITALFSPVVLTTMSTDA